MLLVQIDPIGLELFQALFDGNPNIFRRSFWFALDMRTGKAEFRREKYLVAPSLQARPDKKLGIAAAVVFRRIEEIDARVDRGVDHRMCAFLIHAAAERIASKPHQRGFESPFPADNSSVHISPNRIL